MSPDALKLGILAGGGILPRLLINSCQKSGRPVFVIAFKNQCDEATVKGVDHAWVRLGMAGKAMEILHAHDAHELVMAGNITKPSLGQLMPDVKTLKFLAGGLLNKGDDGLLRAIVETLESKEGFTLVGVQDVMPELLTPDGILGKVIPDKNDQKAIDASVLAAKSHGKNDLGQAAVAHGDQVIALEQRAGTDAMLKTLVDDANAQGCVLAKMCKPDQEKRADLPTIGTTTIENAIRAKLRGVVVEAGASLIIDRDAVIKAADEAGIFIVGIKP